MKWIKDQDFIRGKIPMTKFNVRALTMAHMDLGPGDSFLDIGAGTGSVAIEAALQGAQVTAIEKEPEGVRLIGENAQKFGVDLEIIQGLAPENLPDKSFNKVFIGGSRGQLARIFDYLEDHLSQGGILCGNFIMLKNLEEFTGLLRAYNYENIESHMIQASYVDRLGLLKGENPIFIVKGVKC